MPLVDYKQKYMELKARFMSCVDASWRDGYENGLQAAQMDQMQQQQMQTDAMNQQQVENPLSEEGQAADQTSQENAAPISQNPSGDELGQHIEKLEGMLGKSEISELELQDLKKTLNDIRSLQVQINLTKSVDNIKNTKMGKQRAPLILSPKNQINLPETAKRVLTLQEKIVNNVFKKWGSDSEKTSNDITSILGVDGLIKKE